MIRPRICAIIGAGDIAGAHVEAIRANQPRVSLSAVVDIDVSRADAFAHRQGIDRWFHDVPTMLEEIRPDLVHICTPPSAHTMFCIAAMEAGADVFCEKPLCSSLHDFDLIHDAEVRTGKTCATVFQQRFGSGTVHLRNLIQCGVLGTPLLGICHTLWYRPAAYYNVPWRGKWHTEFGGTTMGHGIHSMDQLLSVLGPWRELQARAATLDRSIEVEDVSMATVQFQSGTLVSIVNSALSPRQETYLRLDCQHATVELTHLYKYDNLNWKFTPAPGMEHLVEQWNGNKSNRLSDHASQLTQLLNDLDEGVPHSTSGRGARETIEFIAALYKSAFLRRPVYHGEIAKEDPFYISYHGCQKTFPDTSESGQLNLRQTAA